MWTPERLVKEAKTLSSLPTIYTRLNEAVSNPWSSNRDIAGIISEDAGLAARLLRIANSAFYGFPSKIDTITRAVTVIGTQQLRDLALATSVINMFADMPNEVVSMESFWQHSIACGVTARILASYRREPNVERFFVAGLLHDVGRLIIYSKMPDIACQALEDSQSKNALLYEIEKEIMGFDHADVGGLLLRQWKIPENTVNAVAFHHKPSAIGEFQMDVSIVHIADIITNALQIGSSGEICVPSMDPNAWMQINLPKSILSPSISELKRQYDEAVKFVLPEAA